MSTRIAFITGGGRGIGRACAFALAAAGHKIVLADFDRASLDETAAALRDTGATVCAVELDLRSPESIERGFAAAAAELGPPTILVNNAGITRDALVLRMKLEDWNAVLQTNLTGAFLAAKQAVQPMMKERWGRIINIASVVGEAGNAGQANYVASKAGLIGLTKTLALEFASRNITVNAIAPGFIETDMTAVLKDEVKAKMLADIPLARFGKPDDIAAAVCFLASESAGYITGQVLRVNGGMYL
jgi:3-oxoacyl-[acyl-carrier protein] reductase